MGSEPALTGAGVIRYGGQAPLEGARRFVVQGTRTADGGCTFGVTASAIGSVPQRGHELAFDIESCRSLMEVGVPVTSGPTTVSPAADPPTNDVFQTDPTWQFDANDFVTDPGAVDVTPSIAGTESVPLAATSRQIALHTWFRDPPGIHVNDATNYVYWSPSSTCAHPPGTVAEASALYQWFTTTGWTFRGRTWSPSFNCTAVTSKSSNIRFRNRLFCAAAVPILVFFPTDTTLNNQIRGLPGGRHDYIYSWSKSGPCSTLLSFEWETFVPGGGP